MAEQEGADKAQEAEDPAAFAPGLRRIRRRRWYLWGVILVYVPAMWLALRLFSSLGTVGWIFAGWFVLLFAVAMAVAVARCPRCGNYFHVNGLTFLCLRRCLHCQLHLKADRRG